MNRHWIESVRRGLNRRTLSALTVLLCTALLGSAFRYADAWDSSSENAPQQTVSAETTSETTSETSREPAAPQDLRDRVFFNGLRGVEQPQDYRFCAGTELSLLRRELSIPVFTNEETIAELLCRLGIYVEEDEAVLIDFSSDVPCITIAGDFICEIEQHELVPCVTRYEENSSLAWGTEQVAQEGADGYIPHYYGVSVEDGKVTRTVYLESGESTMREHIIHYGTQSKNARVRVRDYLGGSITVNGETLSYSKCLRMTGTAYTSGIGEVDAVTATGTDVRVGIVAVDRRVIPLGTRLYIEAAKGSYVYGIAVAEDTGVRGNVIDLYMDSYEDCVNFGSRALNVYILD